jgi:hypothetical protein
VSLIVDAGPLRWPAVVLLVGTLLILAEIMSSQVLLSQIGNLMVWGGSASFAWLLVHREVGAPAGGEHRRGAPRWLAALQLGR